MSLPLFTTTGPQALILPGPAGDLECLTDYPADAAVNTVVIICHPHPLYQGTMHNKVVTTLARAYAELGMATVRFNYRGVGKSAGEYGNVEGEVLDALAVYDWVRSVLPECRIAMAGFSFGAFIAASVASQKACEHLVSVAPAVNHAAYESLVNIDCPWLIVQGEADEVVPVDEVIAWENQLTTPHQFVLLPGVSHFFHGKLLELREQVTQFVDS